MKLNEENLQTTIELVSRLRRFKEVTEEIRNNLENAKYFLDKYIKGSEFDNCDQYSDAVLDIEDVYYMRIYDLAIYESSKFLLEMISEK